MSFFNYDLNPFPYVGSTEGFQQLTAQDVSYNEISNILRESKEFSEEEIKEISECVYSESADDVVMERSVEKVLIKSYRKNYKKVFKNIRRIKLYMFQHKYDEAHMLVTDTISDLIEMKKETEALALDPGKYDLPVLIKIFAFIIKQLVIIIDTILVAVIPVFRHFAVSETKTLSKTKHMLPGNVNADTDFITLKHRILDVYDELIATLTSIDGKISVEKEKYETKKSNSNIVESTHAKSGEVVSDMNRYGGPSIYTEAGLTESAGKLVNHFKTSINRSMTALSAIYKEYQKAVEAAEAYEEEIAQNKERLMNLYDKIVDRLDDLEESLDHDLLEAQSYAENLEDINSILRVVNDEIQQEIDREKEKELADQEEQIDDAVEDISVAMEFCGDIDDTPVYMEDADEDDKLSEKVNPVIVGKCLAIKSIYKSAYNKLLGVVRKLKSKVESLKNKLSNKSVKTESVSIYIESGINDSMKNVIDAYKAGMKECTSYIKSLSNTIKSFDKISNPTQEKIDACKKKIEDAIDTCKKKIESNRKEIASRIKQCENKYHAADLFASSAYKMAQNVSSFNNHMRAANTRARINDWVRDSMQATYNNEEAIRQQEEQMRNQQLLMMQQQQQMMNQMMMFCSCKETDCDLLTVIENTNDDAKNVSPIDLTKYAFINKNYEAAYKKLTEALSKLEQKFSKIKSKLEGVIKKESVDVDESSSSFLGQMLPQTPLTTEEDYNTKEIKDLAKTIDMDYLNDDMDVFDPNSDILESDIMATEAGFIEALKAKFGKKKNSEDTDVDTKLVTDACQLYSKIQNSQNRMKLMLVKDSAAKSTQVYRDYAKTLVASEKKLRVLKKKMGSAETTMFNTYCKNLDGNLKSKMEESIADIKEANAARDKIKMECGDTSFFSGDIECLPQSCSDLYESLRVYNLKLDILFQNIKKKLSAQNYCTVVECLDDAIRLINCSRKTIVSQLSQAGECNDSGCSNMISMAFDHINEIMDKVYSIMSYYSIVDMPRIVTCMKCTCDSQSSISSNINSIVGAYNSIINTINQLKTHTESLCNKSSYTLEAADIDTAIADAVIALNKKGYKTKYSSAGHNKLKPWKDGDGDGKYEGVLNSDARIQFDGCYEFPKPPKYWKWRSVEGNDYLDVIEIKYDKKDGTPPEAFQKWKDKYLSTLATWVKNLPEAKPIVKEKDVKDKDVPEETPKEISKENDVKESVERMFDAMMDTLFFEASF